MPTQQLVDHNARAGAEATEVQRGFGTEFRELARQRRFLRSAEAAEVAAATARPERPRAPRVTASTGAAGQRRSQAMPVAAAPSEGRGARLSDDPYNVLVELSRMADRVIESRESLSTMTARAERAERDLRAMNERVMAARVLVHEAQRTAQAAAERCAFLEGRTEALQDALDLALNASILQRWKWRRAARHA